jgi:hypothetical protein
METLDSVKLLQRPLRKKCQTKDSNNALALRGMQSLLIICSALHALRSLSLGIPLRLSSACFFQGLAHRNARIGRRHRRLTATIARRLSSYSR